MATKIALRQLAVLTASRCVGSDSNGHISALDTLTYPSLAELTYVKGVSSALQTQLNGKAASGSNTDITSVILNQTGLAVKGASGNALTIKPNETLSANRTLNLVTGDSNRTITLSGNPTLNDWFDQSVKTGASPTFSTVTANLFGYTPGSGGTVTQATSKSTGVTINKISGQITMNNASLGSANTVTFTVTNSTVSSTDTVSFSIVGGEATDGSYLILPAKCASGSFKVTVWNISSGSLSEALVIQFNVYKGTSS